MLNSVQEGSILTKFSKTLSSKDCESTTNNLAENGKANSIPPINELYNKVIEIRPPESIESLTEPIKSNYSVPNHKFYIKNIKNEDKDITRAGGLAWLRY